MKKAESFKILSKTIDQYDSYAETMFKLLQPEIKKNLDTLFNIYGNNFKFFESIINKCVNTEPDDIRWFIIDFTGQTPKNQNLLLEALDPIDNLTRYIQGSNKSTQALILEYIDIELVGLN